MHKKKHPVWIQFRWVHPCLSILWESNCYSKALRLVCSVDMCSGSLAFEKKKGHRHEGHWRKAASVLSPRTNTSYIIYWLVVWNMVIFPFSWEFHHPNWRSHIFQRGRLNHQPVMYIYIYILFHYMPVWQMVATRIYLEYRFPSSAGDQQELSSTRIYCHWRTWWLIPLSKWVITPVISGLTLLIPFITGVITHLLSGMSHQVDKSQWNPGWN